MIVSRREKSACFSRPKKQVCTWIYTCVLRAVCLCVCETEHTHVRAPFHGSTIVWVGQACVHGHVKRIRVPRVCVCVCVCEAGVACGCIRVTAVSCTLEHGNAAPPRGTRDGRSGDTESEPQAGLRASLLSLAAVRSTHTLSLSLPTPLSLLVAPESPVSFPLSPERERERENPREAFPSCHLLLSPPPPSGASTTPTIATIATTKRGRSSPRPFGSLRQTPWISSLSLSLSLLVHVHRTRLGRELVPSRST